MKKLLVVLSFILIFGIGYFSSYIQVSNNYKNQYKVAIEQFLNNEVSHFKERIDYDYSQANDVYTQYKKYPNKNNLSETIFELENHKRSIESEEFRFYLTLIYITNSYTPILDKLPITDFSLDLYTFILPYLQNNQINVEKFKNFEKYSENKVENISSYIENISR